MPRAGWLALGGIAVALVAAEIGTVVALASCAAAAAIGAVAAVRYDRRLPFVALGAVLVGARIAFGTVMAPPEPAALPKATEWTARVISVSAPSGGHQRAIVEATPAEPVAVGATTRAQPDQAPSVRVYARLPRYPLIAVGDQFEFRGALEEPPRGTSFGDYLARNHVVATAEIRDAVPAGLPGGSGEPLQQLRTRAAESLATALPEPEAGLAAGILVGLRERVSRDVASAFTTSGLSHVVAISGWNIAIVGGVVAALLASLPRRPRAVAIAVTILFYAVFAGASASVIRAALMAGVALLARESGRRGAAPAALGIAALGMLVLDPDNIWDAGYQLSVAATAGLLRWSNALGSALRAGLPAAVPSWIVESLAVSLAAQLATLPLVLLSFGRLSLVAPLANLGAAPLVAPAMGFSVLALLAGAGASLGMPGAIASAISVPAWALLAAIVAIAERAAALPFASIEIGPPWSLIAAGAAGGAVLVAHRPNATVRVAASAARALRAFTSGAASRAATREPAPGSASGSAGGGRVERPAANARLAALAIAGIAAAVSLFGSAAAQSGGQRLSVTVLDVGQGDAILVEGPRGGRLLVDGGPDPDRLLRVLDDRVPAWDRRLDVAILTHPHEDHVAGFPLLLRRYRVDALAEVGMRGPGPGYRAFAAELAATHRSARILAQGDSIRLDGAIISVLWPRRGAVPAVPPDTGSGINNVSVVLDVRYGARRMLLTGDAEEQIDPELLRAGVGSTAVDLLKVAHHGSGTATTDGLLQAIRPRVAVVSAGVGNPYGHPNRMTLERIAATGAAVLRTDQDGSVTVSTDGSDLRVLRTGPRTRAASAVPAVAFAGWTCAVPVAGPSIPTIGAWEFPAASTPPLSSSSSGRPTGSWPTPARWPRLQGSSLLAQPVASRATAALSKPQRSSMTLTSSFPASTASTARPGRTG